MPSAGAGGIREGAARSPYALPGDAQLLAYWHHQHRAPSTPSTPSAAGAARFERRRRAAKDEPIQELRGGRPSGFSASRYVADVRLLAKWRLVAGQKRDGCIQLDQQHELERQQYREIKREYRECAAALESFLARDHEESMRALSAAEAESRRTSELSERRDELSGRYGRARLQVYQWEEAWRTVKACRSFLRRVSPLGQLDAAEDESEEAGEGAGEEAGEEAEEAEIGSLESIIAAFERTRSALSPASSPGELGLLEAADLLRLFRDIELRNLSALVHLEALGGPMAEASARIGAAELRVGREIEDVFEGIEQLERAIGREERRARRLERQSARLVQRRFRALVCSAEALRARILLEEAYEGCVAPNEAGLGPLAMARGLEAAYERLSAELDALPRHLVLACERDGFQQEMRQSREAAEAARKFELMQRLLGALRRIMEPTESRRRVLMRRSSPNVPGRRCAASAAAAAKEQTRDKSPIAREALQLDFFEKLCKPKRTDGEEDGASDDDD
ncbi:uncharacterized protein LOC100678390 [Nasonia vitripennis]|uniref:Uncharacterized protein n=1 Tax=Nasonia vitripennis TaxID=7425 RepID=A0A7M7LNI8_NASVI|nr:uncharacterized protein LOC100678390 [Nasonia vitripennis]